MSLKDLRQRSGLTQKEAASVFGLKYRTYQTTSLEIQVLIWILRQSRRYFKCTIGELFDLEEGDGEQMGSAER